MATQSSSTTGHSLIPKRCGQLRRSSRKRSTAKLSHVGVAVFVVWIMAAVLVATTAVTSDVTSVKAQDTTQQQVPASVRSYAAEFSVSLEEAKRRLDRIQPI